jgi:hypothetical protein
MTDPKRLPVIYAVFDEEGLVRSDTEELSRMMLPGRIGARYVPEPATCATCAFFEKSKVYAGMICRWGTAVRQDGSGYCHNHPDNQRAKGG